MYGNIAKAHSVGDKKTRYYYYCSMVTPTGIVKFPCLNIEQTEISRLFRILKIPYHTEIMESFNGIDLDSARKVAGNGFYYLMGDIARLHSAVIAYARDFMINRGFTYCVPPFMIRSNVVTGVMSFAEMDSMMYKIEGEDLYLIGTSEHSMIGKFIFR